jgi:hypothetical protein
MAAPNKVKLEIWARAAGMCSICKCEVIDASLGHDKASLIGQVAHIVAEQIDGPRGNSALTPEERNSQSNLLLLCPAHHKLVDDHPENYAVTTLEIIKDKHESWVKNCLTRGKPWSFNIQNLFYVNVPRLGMLAKFMGISIELSGYFQLPDLRSLGMQMLNFLSYFEQLLGQLHPKAIPLADLLVNNSSIGCVCAFSGRFRTKNVGKALGPKWQGIKGNLDKDPYIYCDHATYKLVLPIDPRWITTSTAGVHLSSGQGNYSGLCLINSIDDEMKIIYASPLIIGQAINPQMTEFLRHR